MLVLRERGPGAASPCALAGWSVGVLPRARGHAECAREAEGTSAFAGTFGYTEGSSPNGEGGGFLPELAIVLVDTEAKAVCTSVTGEGEVCVHMAGVQP